MIVKLLSYNIRFGGRGRQKDLAEVIRSVAPDIVVFQEATDPGLISGLATVTDLPFWSARREHSIGYISRLEIAHHEWHYPAGAKHSFLEIVLAGSDTRIFGLHLSSTFSKWSERRRVREIQSLLKSIERYQEGFHVLVGDFNTLAPGEILDVRRMPAWIRGLVWLSGRDIQRDTIQHIKDSGYVDGYRFLHPDIKGYTFPVWDPHLRLDYVFLPKQFASRLLSCEVIEHQPQAIRASDHFPLLANVEF
ncbi:MAG: endonuclease/exonuclease/phosphatase family protein [Acidobacteriota bacterium]|nr:endonuclease/exonuclease/phosphatase family protein [Acidobacteriota bacterium]